MLQNLFLGKRADYHDHLTAFHLGHVFDLAEILNVLGDAFQKFTAQILVCHLSTAEAQGNLDLIAVLQKLEHIAHLDVIVMRIGVGPELDLFDLDDLLLPTSFAFAFLLLVLELAKIHDFADRRVRVGRNFNQIKAHVGGHLHRFGGMNYPDVFTFGTNQANLGGTDLFIDARSGISLRRRVVRSASYGIIPLMIAEIRARNLDRAEQCFKRHKPLGASNFHDFRMFFRSRGERRD